MNSFFSKLSLLYFTLRYLKPIQVFYQVWYSLKSPLLQYYAYDRYFSRSLYPLKCNYSSLIVSVGKVNDYNSFTFLNLHHRFTQSVDWNFIEFGKLWNYNLQYFDYLLDYSIDDKYKRLLIEDFSNNLLNRNVKPEPYPVSLRVINWILYSSKSGCQSPIFNRALKYQIDYLRCNLEYHILANHLLENIISLCIASIALKEDSLKSKMFGKLEKQLEEQILPDGAHYECSPMYHQIILSRLLLLVDILKNNDPLNLKLPYIVNCCAQMLGWLKAFSFEDGSYAYVNDSAKGISPDTQILIETANLLDITPKKVKLKDSGYRKFCRGNYEVVIDAGNIQPSYQPGHTHSDALSYCIQYNNKPLVVDTGTSTYQAGIIRNKERSTSAHNTVSYNNAEPTQTWSSFRVGRRAKVTITAERDDQFRAQHNGFKSFSVYHKRLFSFKEDEVIINDDLGDEKNYESRAYIHFDYQYGKPELVDNKVYVGRVCQIDFKNVNNINVEDYKQAVGFNLYKDSFRLVITFSNQLKTTFKFL